MHFGILILQEVLSGPDTDTAGSTFGNLILMKAGAISWYFGRQTTTALSTALAETIARSKVVAKVKYFRAILFDLTSL